LQQFPQRGDLGDPGQMGLAPPANFIGRPRTFRNNPQPKKPGINPQHAPNISATSTFEAEKCLTRPASRDTASQWAITTVFDDITIYIALYASGPREISGAPVAVSFPRNQ
jgi:hypothetical protein